MTKTLNTCCILTLLTGLWVILPLPKAAPPVQPPLQENGVALTLHPPQVEVAPGDTLTFTVNVENLRTDPLEDLELQILFPPDAIAPQEIIRTEDLLPAGDRWERPLSFDLIGGLDEPLEAIVTLRYAGDDPETPLTSTLTLLPAPPPPSPEPTVAPTTTAEPTPEPAVTPVALIEPETPTPEAGLLDDLIPGLAGVGALLVLGLVGILLLVAVLLLHSILGKRRRTTTAPLSPAPPPLAGPHLSFKNKDGKTRQVRLREECITLGRSTNNVLVIDSNVPRWETVSRYHARIYRKGGFWVFEDLDSRNGIYVNAQRTGRNLLRDGWQLGVGAVQLTFHTGKREASE
ncbi:MAG: FHA domain-containing protein [Anaerolineales bacterium]